MGSRGIGALAVTLVVVTAAFSSRAFAIDFDDIPAGTVYGTPDDAPGDVVLDEDGLRMSVENFVIGSSELFFFATVEPAGTAGFPTQSLSLDNISVRFDFAELGYAVDLVTFELADFGGTSNFSVNDDTLFILDPFTDLPANVAPGVTASIDNGLVTLTGPIQAFLVGGQELFIDNVTAVPDPATGLLLALGSLVVWRGADEPSRTAPTAFGFARWWLRFALGPFLFGRL